MENNRKKGDMLLTMWNALGIAVILGFFVFSVIIGGNAGNGYQENGHFYVASHGDIVEVSKVIWNISNVWEVLFWIFIPLTPIGAFVIASIQERIEREKNRFE